jgi:peptidoglycan/LPS O-acetylase OafA/YrhL
MTRIPSLDGWRAIAIMMVLIAHFGPLGSRNFDIGQQGVAFFFILSGYLITSNLLREKEAGSVDLQAFYVRRFFRLMPVAWTMLLVVSIFGVTTPGEVASCVFFYRNFLAHPKTLVTSHFWSLSIEEQFYLAWPWALGWMTRSRARSLAIGAAAVLIACRIITPESFILSHCGWTQFHAETLLIGCVFALTPRIPKMPVGLLLASIPLVGMCVHLYPHIPPVGESVLVGWMIHTTAQGKTLLDWKPLRQIGIMSYSIYIWQTPLTGFPHSTPLRMLETMTGLAALTALSFYFIEKPGRRFGARVLGSPSASGGNRISGRHWRVSESRDAIDVMSK